MLYISARPSARVRSLSLSPARYPVSQSALLMTSCTTKSGAATERTEEPQLAAATGNDGTATELQAKKAIRKAKLELHTAKKLAEKWDARQITYKTSRLWEWKLLQEFWDGSLEQRVAELGAPNPCRRSPYASIVGATTATEHGAGE